MRKNQPLLPDTILTIYCLKGCLPAHFDSDIDGFLGNWEEDDYSFLFFRQPDESFVEALLDQGSRLELEDRFTMTYRDWQGGFGEPVKIGRFLLNPPWLKRVADKGDIALNFDPGLVFGNGTHPTTLACLAAIEIACSGSKIERMLDLGTGTGLLALVGAKLGCKEIIAVDNNMLAARTAANNVKINDLGHQILVANGLAQAFVTTPSDLLVANIGSPVLQEILLDDHVFLHRWLVLSGLQNEEVHKIRTLLADLDILVLKHWQSDGVWNTILAITRDGR